MAQLSLKTPSTPVIYRDINLSFAKNPATGDLNSVTNEEAIKRSVKHLILSNFYERPFEPNIGGNIASQLFEPATPFTELILNNSIKEVIQNFDPRVILLVATTQIIDDENLVKIRIKYAFNNVAQTTLEFSLTLERAR